MTAKQIAGVSVDVNDEGFLLDPKQWNRDIAGELAKEEGIELGEGHWKVIDFVSNDAQANGEPPNVRRLTKVGGIPTKDLYTLFPGGPAKKAAKIAGYPKPHGCI